MKLYMYNASARQQRYSMWTDSDVLPLKLIDMDAFLTQ